MVGMYGSNEELDIYTCDEIIKLKPDFVRIYPTVVIRQTELYELYENKIYKPYSLEEAVRISAGILKKFNSHRIDVIRIGLMAGEDINEKNVYGPYHSSFRVLVESYLYYEKLYKEIEELPYKKIKIVCEKKETSKIIGNKRCNIVKLINELNLETLNVENDNINGYIIKEDI